MDIIGLDKYFQPVMLMHYLNLQWKRRYYEAGQHSMRILASDFDERVKYFYTSQRPEIGLVEKIELTHELKGDFVQLSGRFMEGVLSRMYAYPKIKGSYTLYELGKVYIEDPWYYVHNYSITVDEAVSKDITVDVEWNEEPLGESAYTTLETLEMSQRLVYHPQDHSFTWLAWQGLDRTQDQNENSWAMFSDESHFVQKYNYIEDESAWRNHCMLLYGEDGAGDPHRYDKWPENSQEEGLRTLLVRESEELTAAQRHQRAEEELIKYPIAQSARFEVLQDGLYYLQDYDLGDKCDVVCHKLGKSFSARITEIDETWKEGQHIVDVVLGKGTLTGYERLKRYSRSSLKARVPVS